MINIDKNKTRLDLNKFEKFQSKLDFKLPKEYKDFLLKYNGGTPEPNIYENKNISISVQYFYGIDDDLFSSIENKIKVMINRMPDAVIPIAEFEGGDVACLVLSKEKYGEIFLWEHDKECEEFYAKNINSMKRIAKSFNNFLTLLEPFKDNENKELKVKSMWVNPDFLKKLNS